MKTLSALSLAAVLWAQDARPRPGVPVEPVGAIVDAFKSHQLVALADPHGNVQINAVRLSLIRDPRFAATVNDIVVEFGNARYQERMDRFVRGEDVAEDSLREVWQNTTIPNIGWDRPIYEEFFRAVRTVNASLPSARRLRVLLGDPPIDWSTVRTTDDLMKWMNDRDTYPADLIRREVLAKQRRALLIYGGGHFPRIDPGTLVSLVEKASNTRVFTVWTDTDTDLPALQANVATWAAPSLVLLRDTLLGTAPFTTIFPVRGDQLRAMRIEDQFDAWLYLGPRSSLKTSPLAPAHCLDAAYMEMRTSRMKLLPGPPGAPDPGEQLKRYCAAQAPK
jgi:hypothetical protein